MRFLLFSCVLAGGNPCDVREVMEYRTEKECVQALAQKKVKSYCITNRQYALKERGISYQDSRNLDDSDIMEDYENGFISEPMRNEF